MRYICFGCIDNPEATHAPCLLDASFRPVGCVAPEKYMPRWSEAQEQLNAVEPCQRCGGKKWVQIAPHCRGMKKCPDCSGSTD